jgi:hypothetical protein
MTKAKKVAAPKPPKPQTWHKRAAEGAIEQMIEYLSDDSFELVAPDDGDDPKPDDAELVLQAMVDLLTTSKFRKEWRSQYKWYLVTCKKEDADPDISG